MLASVPFDPGDEDFDLAKAFLRERSEEAFRVLYRRHTPAVLLLARRLLGGEAALAEDSVQEAWVRAARGLAGFRWESSLRTWLCGIAVRCCREALRARSRRREDPLGEEDGVPGPLLGLPDERVDLEREIRRLSDGSREVFVLHDLAGYTHAEIADLLEIEPGSSKSRLCRARRALRARLGGREIRWNATTKS